VKTNRYSCLILSAKFLFAASSQIAKPDSSNSEAWLFPRKGYGDSIRIKNMGFFDLLFGRAASETDRRISCCGAIAGEVRFGERYLWFMDYCDSNGNLARRTPMWNTKSFFHAIKSPVTAPERLPRPHSTDTSANVRHAIDSLSKLLPSAVAGHPK
jgi:hypothetical protein